MNLHFPVLLSLLLAPGVCLAAEFTPPSESDHVAGHVLSAGVALDFATTAELGASFVCSDYWSVIVARGTVEAREGHSVVRLPPLPPGWYRVLCGQTASIARIDFGIVLDRGDRPLPAAGRVGIDAGSAWLLHDETQRPVLARMLRLAGIPWVRERISWSDTELRRGAFDWSRYQTPADTLAAEGVRISQLWHDSPPWTRTTGSTANTPEDLRDIYNWTRAAAAHFGRQIQAWEVWNEMDIPPFWSELGDRYAAALKAAYWGLKDGNPDALVVMGALAANPPGTFARSFYESGGMAYADRFNWHIYTAPASYAGALAAHRTLQHATGAALRPAWITEAGDLISGMEGPGKRRLDEAGRQAQARYAAQSVVSSLAAGDERHFFFVLPDYLENGVQFGALEPDLSPYPSFVALSAAANFLGESTSLGAWPAPEGVTAYAFATPRGPLLVLWSDSERALDLPYAAATATVANCFGATRTIRAVDGRLALPVGPEVTYLFTPDAAVLAQVKAPPAPPAVAPAPTPSRFVVTGSALLTASKESNTYRIGGPDTPVRFRVEVYDFDPTEHARGVLQISAPPGWKVSPDRIACHVEPFGRFIRDVSLLPADVRDTAPRAVTVTGRFPGQRTAPSVSYFQRDLSGIPPARTLTLAWLPAQKWKPEVAPVGTVTVTDVPDGVRMEAHFRGMGDRWAYPVLVCDPPLDLSDYDGLAFTLEADAPTPNSWVRVLLTETNGAAYMTGTQELGRRQPVVLLFTDMKHMGFSATDPDGRLDLDRIASIKLGLNTPGDFMGLTVTSLRAVKFSAAPASSP